MMRIFRVLSFLVVGAFLGGCVTNTDSWNERMASATSPSAALKQNLLKIARDVVFDPGSIRDSEISNVFENRHPYAKKNNGKIVCVKFNSKNRMGGYAGRTTYLVLIAKDKPYNAITGSPLCNHPMLKWQTFPEANSLASL